MKEYTILDINENVVKYVEENILPIYNQFDNAHNIKHAHKVIKNSLKIAKDYDVNINMVYVIAAYHDIGLINGRENHHIDSGKLVLEDKKLKEFFTDEEIKIISQSVIDHRASNDYEPYFIYGKIVAEADRDIEYFTILKRTIAYSYHAYPNYTKEEHLKRTIEHIENKYGEKGYLRLWLNTEDNTNNLSLIREKLTNINELEEDIINLL